MHNVLYSLDNLKKCFFLNCSIYIKFFIVYMSRRHVIGRYRYLLEDNVFSFEVIEILIGACIHLNTF